MSGIWNELAAELTGSFTATAPGIAALRLVAALLLGGRIGLERELHDKAAGVAFLAAGSIIVSGGHVQGLTTGAGMWLAGAVGLACGTGHAGLGVMASVLALTVLWLFKGLSDRIR